MKYLRVSRSLASCLIVWGLAFVACAPDLQSGVYRCEPQQPGSCPAGWICQTRGAGNEPRCYESAGSYCGDGMISPGEECDGEALGDADACATKGGFPFCRVDCKIACTSCGNGVREITAVGGEECDDGNDVVDDGCSPTCALPRCGDGVVDRSLFEDCDDGSGNSNAPNARCRLNCQARRCGDKVVDFGEVCDDGNVNNGDGCSPNCLSNETCGNGVVDFLIGEQCDNDTNGLSHDGCSSDCLLETPRFKQTTPAQLSPRYGLIAAYDASRGRLVVFGGAREPDLGPDEIYNDTLEWNGAGWTEYPEAGGPPPGLGYVMAYDSARQRTMLYTGTTLWKWDGIEWQNLVIESGSPRPANGCVMTFDARSGKLIAVDAGKTWAWDDSSRRWVDITPVGASPTQLTSSMSFDPISGLAHVQAGTSMWEWDGTIKRWTMRSFSTPTPLRGQMTFDAVRRALVLIDADAHIWQWSRISRGWTKLLPATRPPKRMNYAVAYFGARDRTLLLGGTTGVYGGEFDDVWEWNGATWAEGARNINPPTAAGKVVYEASTGRTLLMSNETAEAWSWGKNAWAPLSAAPPALSGARITMAYDQIRRRVLLYRSTFSSYDAWEWNGAQWSNVAAPRNMGSSQALYDSLNRRISIFGSGTENTDELQWTGVGWQNGTILFEKVGGACKTYDSARGRFVLFGGGAQPSRTDTYEKSSGSWAQTPTIFHPPSAGGDGFFYDPILRRALLPLGQRLWAWSGTEWTSQLIESITPNVANLVYDAVERAAVGHISGYEADRGLWTLRYQHPLSHEESCLYGFDTDGDRRLGCNDPDCWGYCTPGCAPGETCAANLPRCGDGVCNAALENCRICPGDCGSCAAVCGDYLCDSGESASSCPGDCRP